MMQALHVRRETAAILLFDLHLIMSDVRLGSFGSWDADCTEVGPKAFPGRINFRPSILSECIELKERSIEANALKSHICIFYDRGFISVSGDLLISLLPNVQYSEMCRILKTSASSPWRAAQAPNSAESTAVHNSTILVATHDWRRLGILVGSPSTDEVSLCASKPSLSSDFTGLYDSRFCVLPNILMVQTTRGCMKDNG